MHPWLIQWLILIILYIFGYYIILVPLFLLFCSFEDFANVLHCEKWQEWMYANIVFYVSLKDSHSLTTLMPRDLAEPMMLLTTFCIEMSRSLKLSSCDLTRAISYTALTVTIPAISCPEWRNKAEGEREGWWETSRRYGWSWLRKMKVEMEWRGAVTERKGKGKEWVHKKE